MSKSRGKGKGLSPEQQERLDERRRAKLEKARLEAQGVTVNMGPDGKIAGAYRLDVVAMMHRADKIGQAEVDAVRRLEGLIEKAVGPSPCCLASLDRVSGGPSSDPAAVKVQAAIALTERQKRMDSSTWALLRQLCEGNLISTRWPNIAFWIVSGETNDDAKKGAMRMAFRALAAVEEQIAREGRMRRAA